MPPAQRAPGRYSVTSLARGLSILRAMHEADGPIRNREIVDRTGLPKATVSRLLGTLSARGYVRRLDTQGSYVTAHSSARPGRALLDTLGLETHCPKLRALFGDAWVGWLHAQVVRRTVRVFRWSSDGSSLLATDTGAEMAPRPVLDCFTEVSTVGAPLRRCWHEWTDAGSQFIVSTPLELEALGRYVLSVELQLASSPSIGEIESIHGRLLEAADVIAAKALGRTESAT